MTIITGPCAEDPESWFPASTDHAAIQHAAIQHAKAICHTCPAQVACLELAMSNEFGSKNARAGIYGGTTPAERARMHKDRAEQAKKGQRYTVSGKRVPAPIKHGTHSGYVTHRSRGSAACDPCKAAHSAYVKRRAS